MTTDITTRLKEINEIIVSYDENRGKTTLAAMKEAETSDNLETLDLGSFRSFVESL